MKRCDGGRLKGALRRKVGEPLPITKADKDISGSGVVRIKVINGMAAGRARGEPRNPQGSESPAYPPGERGWD